MTRIERIVLALLLAVALFYQRPNTVHAQPMVPKTTGQQAVTGTAAALPNLGIGVACIKALPANTLTVYIGFVSTVTTSTGYPLAASESYCTQVSNLNTFYVVASTTGSSVAWATSNNAGQ